MMEPLDPRFKGNQKMRGTAGSAQQRAV